MFLPQEWEKDRAKDTVIAFDLSVKWPQPPGMDGVVGIQSTGLLIPEGPENRS